MNIHSSFGPNNRNSNTMYSQTLQWIYYASSFIHFTEKTELFLLEGITNILRLIFYLMQQRS